jgi:hypothetical protein
VSEMATSCSAIMRRGHSYTREMVIRITLPMNIKLWHLPTLWVTSIIIDIIGNEIEVLRRSDLFSTTAMVIPASAGTSPGKELFLKFIAIWLYFIGCP